jgi:iron(III) transport system permease protein
VYLCVSAALRGLSSDAEEAACSAGANPWRVALDVSLPMATPAILFAGVLVFLLGFEMFGLPLVLGDPQGLLVLSTYLYKLSNNLAVSPYQLMAVVAVIIAAITLPLVVMLRLLLSEAQRHVEVRTKGLRSARLKLGPWRWTAFLAIVLWLTVTVLVPVVAITLRSFVESRGEGIALPEVLTLDHYRALLGHADATRSMINTLGIGLTGGAAAVVVYNAIALAIHRWPSDWARSRLSRDGALRHAGIGRGSCAALGLFVFQAAHPLRRRHLGGSHIRSFGSPTACSSSPAYSAKSVRN